MCSSYTLWSEGEGGREGDVGNKEEEEARNRERNEREGETRKM